jgi:hypothetical protein
MYSQYCTNVYFSSSKTYKFRRDKIVRLVCMIKIKGEKLNFILTGLGSSHTPQFYCLRLWQDLCSTDGKYMMQIKEKITVF